MTGGWLRGRVVIVTGGFSGIGEAVVERFVNEGASVCILDTNAELGKVDSESIISIVGDVTSAVDNRRAVSAAVEAFGRLDVFVGNAGVFDGKVGIGQMTDDQFEAAFTDIFSVNVKGYLLGVRAALPELNRTGGCVILTLSSAGFYAAGGGSIYTASKHAGVGLVRQLAHELAPTVRVNGVAPGGTVTALRGPAALGQADRSFYADDPTWPDQIRAGRPLRIAASAADHTGAYVYLASDENSRAVTGEIIRSDGGLAAR